MGRERTRQYGKSRLQRMRRAEIGPQDILQIDVWKEPEITRTIPVRPDEKSGHS